MSEAQTLSYSKTLTASRLRTYQVLFVISILGIWSLAFGVSLIRSASRGCCFSPIRFRSRGRASGVQRLSDCISFMCQAFAILCSIAGPIGRALRSSFS